MKFKLNLLNLMLNKLLMKYKIFLTKKIKKLRNYKIPTKFIKNKLINIKMNFHIFKKNLNKILKKILQENLSYDILFLIKLNLFYLLKTKKMIKIKKYMKILCYNIQSEDKI